MNIPSLVGRHWSDMTPSQRNGLIAEMFFDILPNPGDVVRPFDMVDGFAIWKRNDQGFIKVPNYTETWASAMKLVTALQEKWRSETGVGPSMFDKQPFVFWRLCADLSGWTVTICENNGLDGEKVLHSSHGETLPLLACETALKYLGVLQ